MRLSTVSSISALSWLASARWLAFSPDPVIDIRGGDLARPTQPPDINDYQQWAPQPTPPPERQVVELLLHRRQRTGSSSPSNNTWENAQTCGWYSGISSQPYECDSPLSCSTNTDNVVACATDGLEQFYTICLNYEAVRSGKCTSAGPQTGCCQNSAQPECGTFVWTGTPVRSMFKCFPTATLISMIDEPQFVIDASRSSVAASLSSAAAASRSSEDAAAQTPIGPSTVVATTTAADGSAATVTSVLGGNPSASAGAGAGGGSDGGSGTSSTSTGAIAGGVVGGIALLALLLLLLWYLLRKKNKFTLSLCGGSKKTNKEKHVHNKNYNEKNVKNDNRAYDKRSYSNRNSYDNSKSYDNKGYYEQNPTYNQPRSHSGASHEPVNQHFHFHVDDDRNAPSPDSRPSGTREPEQAHLGGAAAVAVAPAASRRERRRQARQQRAQPEAQELDREEFEQAQEQQGGGGTHRYHPSSRQRFPDAPPPAPRGSAPNLDFIGRGI